MQDLSFFFENSFCINWSRRHSWQCETTNIVCHKSFAKFNESILRNFSFIFFDYFCQQFQWVLKCISQCLFHFDVSSVAKLIFWSKAQLQVNLCVIVPKAFVWGSCLFAAVRWLFKFLSMSLKFYRFAAHWLPIKCNNFSYHLFALLPFDCLLFSSRFSLLHFL